MSARVAIAASRWRVRKLTNRPAPTPRTATRPTTPKATAMRMATRSRIGDQAVADAADGFDGWTAIAELLAQLRHMDVDGPRLAREVGPPDVLEEHLAAENGAGVAGQRGKEIELAGSQLHRPAGHGHLAAAGLDPQAADLDRPAQPDGPVGPAEDRLDPGDEGARIEWFGHVVVGAELEAHDR